MIKIEVDNGALEVWCKDREQARAYIEGTLKQRGYKSFTLWEMKNGQQKQVESRRQIQENIQKPTEVRTGGAYEGL